jgi:hypothetical protein
MVGGGGGVVKVREFDVHKHIVFTISDNTTGMTHLKISREIVLGIFRNISMLIGLLFRRKTHVCVKYII